MGVKWKAIGKGNIRFSVCLALTALVFYWWSHPGALKWRAFSPETAAETPALPGAGVLRGFIVLMALGFIVNTILGIIMALTQGTNRRKAFYCLAFGVLFPAAVMVISVFAE